MIDDDFSSIILTKSLKMAESKKVTMVWEENKIGTKDLFLKWIEKNNHSDEFQKYNYPRAFLFAGIITFLKKTQDQKQLISFKNLFEEYVKDDGEPNFLLNRVDQAPFGIAAIYLYEVFGESKHLKFAEHVFAFLESNIDYKENIIDYRPGLGVVLNDMLGLVIPFLLEYSRITKHSNARQIAEQQMNYYNKFGIDSASCIPSHGINKETKTKVGSSNWGRGIGWYMIGLSYCTKFNIQFTESFEKIKTSILDLKTKENLWTQFPGNSKTFDASATLMILYAILLQDKSFVTRKELFTELKNYLTEDGIIMQTSGDTVGLNEYSKSFGSSELSQGLLLLVLSELD